MSFNFNIEKKGQKHAEKKIIDAIWDDSPVNVTTEVNFIWSIANKLRGPYQSDKYKDVIIPMTIIRRFKYALAPSKKAVVSSMKRTLLFLQGRCTDSPVFSFTT